MNWADYAILGVVGLSMLISLIRGFVREAMALAVWVAAFWVGIALVDNVEVQLTPWVDSPTARLALAFVGLFLATLLVGGIVNFLVGQLVDKTGLSGTDRFVGLWFGALRALVVLVAVVLVAGWTPLPKERWWQASMFLPRLEQLAAWSADFLPQRLKDVLDLHQQKLAPAGTEPEAEPEQPPQTGGSE